MSKLAWSSCVAWLAFTVVVALWRGVRGARAGRAPRAVARLKGPTVYLFSIYLLVAALVTPVSPGESVSPLFALAFALPIFYALATLSAIGDERPARSVALALAMLHGGALLAAGAAILAISSPRFVPSWMR